MLFRSRRKSDSERQKKQEIDNIKNREKEKAEQQTQSHAKAAQSELSNIKPERISLRDTETTAVTKAVGNLGALGTGLAKAAIHGIAYGVSKRKGKKEAEKRAQEKIERLGLDKPTEQKPKNPIGRPPNPPSGGGGGNPPNDPPSGGGGGGNPPNNPPPPPPGGGLRAPRPRPNSRIKPVSVRDITNVKALPSSTRKALPEEQVDIYDIILSHLLDEGYADTLKAAEVMMVNMSEDWIDSILDEAYVDYQTGRLPSGRTPQQALTGSQAQIGRAHV